MAGDRPLTSRLTVAIAAHEASHDVAESLRSAAAIADEMFVVYAGSFPTARVEAPGLRSLEFADADDPAAARNLLMEAATGDWVLWLEPGESVDLETAAAIRQWLATDAAEERQAAYLLWIETPAQSADQSAEQLAAPRLLPRVDGLRFHGRVRETLQPSLERLGMDCMLTHWRLQDHPEIQQPAFRTALARRQLRLAGLDIQSFGMSPRALTASAEAHAALGDSVKATQHYYQALRLADRGSIEMLAAYYGLLATFRGDETDKRQQLAVCLEALESFPLDAQLLCAMGTYLQLQDHVELACRSFRAAVEIGQSEPQTAHLKDVQAIAAVSWSLLLQIRGEFGPALDVLTNACEKFPDCGNLPRRRLELIVQLGRDVEALALAPTIARPDTPIEPLRIGLRGACLAAQGNWIPALTYLRTAYENNCRDPICLRWYTVGLLGLSQFDAVRPVLKAWQLACPGDAEAARYSAELDALLVATPERGEAKKKKVRVDRPTPAVTHLDAAAGHVDVVNAPQH